MVDESFRMEPELDGVGVRVRRARSREGNGVEREETSGIDQSVSRWFSKFQLSSRSNADNEFSRYRLKNRFILVGLLNALFAPFIVVYLLIYSFFRYFEVSLRQISLAKQL